MPAVASFLRPAVSVLPTFRFFFPFLCLILPLPASAQLVRGRTVDAATREPVPEVEVTLLDSAGTARLTVLSNEFGEFVLVAADSGRYTVQGTRLGYAVAHSGQVELRWGQTLLVELRMSVQPVELEPLKVLAAARSLRQRDLNEYYQRVDANREKHWGWIFARDDLEPLNTWTLTEFLRRAAPLQFMPRFMRCSPTMYWDGVRLMPGHVDAMMSLYRIEGIEFYRGFGPAQIRFVDPNGCGVILIWSRPLDRRNSRPFDFGTLAAAIAGFAVIGWLVKLGGI